MPAFFDSNVPLYLLSGDEEKSVVVEDLLEVGGHVSVQVLNEFVSVALRKYKAPWARVEAVRSALIELCTVQPLTLSTHQEAVRISRRYGFHIYDANVIACALACRAEVLYTEDLQHGQKIESLRVTNPFIDS